MKNRNVTFTTIFLALACFGLLPQMQAVVPAPDGCYPGFTTAEGCKALNSLTTGAGNTGVGWYSLFFDTTGSFNTGVGGGTLVLNNADSNTAVGAAALLLNTTGTENVAVGTDALVLNDSGDDNCAVGAFALTDNTTGFSNTAVGADALELNTEGFGNTAIGQNALSMNTTGLGSTAIGGGALMNNTTGNRNIAVGIGAGSGIAMASDTICIGTAGHDVSNTCFIGNIRGVTTQNANAIPVLIDSAGQLGTVSSSRRYKTDIKPIDKASESILALKPVSFRYKVHKDSTPQFGLIAEEVAEVNPNLVIYDADGKPYTVRYDAVNTMLLNEFLKEHRAFMEEQHKVAQQQEEIDFLKAELKEQRSLIQKVSDNMELKSSTPQVVVNK